MFVYIDEAHAGDEWPVGSHLNHHPDVAKQPTTTQARLEVTKEHLLPFLRQKAPELLPAPENSSCSSEKRHHKDMDKDEKDDSAMMNVKDDKDDSDKDEMTNVHWFIDPPESQLFEDVYAPWPIRFWIVSAGKMAYIAEPENGQFCLKKLDAKLQQTLLVNGD